MSLPICAPGGTTLATGGALRPDPGQRVRPEFEVFFLEHHDDALRSLDAILNDHEAAVDATQDAFIKAHARWSVIRTYDAPQAWVRRIAINASRDRLRSERRRRDRETRVDPVDEPTGLGPDRRQMQGYRHCSTTCRRASARSRQCSTSTTAAWTRSPGVSG